MVKEKTTESTEATEKLPEAVELQKPMLADAVKTIKDKLGGLVLEVYLVGSRTTGLTGDVDIAVVSPKADRDLDYETEYPAVLDIEESLTKCSVYEFLSGFSI